MKRVIKKINPEFFDAIDSGKKKYELRLNDEDISEGDTLILKEWDSEKKEYTGRKLTRTITYTRTFKIDELHWSEEEVRKHGLRLMSLD